MKNRKTILLVVLAVGVWGTIGFKIYTQMTDDGPAMRIMPVRHVRDTTAVEQRLQLVLSYDDPFLKTPVKKPVVAQVKRTVPKHKPAAVPVMVVDWNRVKYMGSISNGSRKKMMATLKLDNADYLLKEGETFGDFSLEKIYRDSVKVGYEKSTKYIKRE